MKRLQRDGCYTVGNDDIIRHLPKHECWNMEKMNADGQLIHRRQKIRRVGPIPRRSIRVQPPKKRRSIARSGMVDGHPGNWIHNNLSCDCRQQHCQRQCLRRIFRLELSLPVSPLALHFNTACRISAEPHFRPPMAPIRVETFPWRSGRFDTGVHFASRGAKPPRKSIEELEACPCIRCLGGAGTRLIASLRSRRGNVMMAICARFVCTAKPWS